MSSLPQEVALIENRILSALPQFEYKPIKDNLELVKLWCGEVLFEVSEKLDCIYFPTSAIISFMAHTEEGAVAEITRVGNEGLVDILSFLGVKNSYTQALVSHTGEAYRISLKLFQALLARSGGRREGLFQNAIMRYAASFFIQTSQAATCKHSHPIALQLCTWLLLSFSRANTDTLSLSHETIGYYLGTPADAVREVIGKLADLGLIRCKQQGITLLNRREMEKYACECYKMMDSEII